MTVAQTERAQTLLTQQRGAKIGALSKAQIHGWLSALLPVLNVLRGVEYNSTFIDIVCDELYRNRFTKSEAVIADEWLKRGSWDRFRKRGALSASDFYPSFEDITSLGVVNDLIDKAAYRILREKHQNEYLHRNEVTPMLSEARSEARQQALSESKENNGKYVHALMQKQEEINSLHEEIKRQQDMISTLENRLNRARKALLMVSKARADTLHASKRNAQ